MSRKDPYAKPTDAQLAIAAVAVPPGTVINEVTRRSASGHVNYEI